MNTVTNDHGTYWIDSVRIKYGSNFRNFSGVRTDYNNEGNRHVYLFLSDEQAEYLSNEGFNVKVYIPKDKDTKEPLPNHDPEPYLDAKVNFDSFRPLNLHMVSPKNDVLVTKDNAGELDQASIAYADVGIRGSHWEKNGRSGISAYINQGNFFIEESRLDMSREAYQRNLGYGQDEESPF